VDVQSTTVDLQGLLERFVPEKPAAKEALITRAMDRLSVILPANCCGGLAANLGWRCGPLTSAMRRILGSRKRSTM